MCKCRFNKTMILISIIACCSIAYVLAFGFLFFLFFFERKLLANEILSMDLSYCTVAGSQFKRYIYFEPVNKIILYLLLIYQTPSSLIWFDLNFILSEDFPLCASHLNTLLINRINSLLIFVIQIVVCLFGGNYIGTARDNVDEKSHVTGHY